MPMLTAAQVRAFRARVRDHFARNRRDFSWRRTRDPYHVLVSEVMLQQTQTARVDEKFPSFIASFPTVRSLANATPGAVLRAWQGMGYNRRALYLQRAARDIVERFGGSVPRTVDELGTLPGIGPATARSIAVYAFGLPVAFIETNIRAVFIHEFFPEGAAVADDAILPLVERTLDRRDPWTWYNALMDYGVMLKERHGNPARRSAHHVRQAPFAGSDRQVRGAILRALAGGGGIARHRLRAGIPAAPGQFSRCLAALRREGLVVCAGGAVRLP